MERRNTIQKTLINDAVQSMHNHPSADDIYEKVTKQYPNVSKGTVYRNLNQMAEDGDIQRIEIPNTPDRYDYDTSEHGHFQCVHCGKVIDYPLEYPHWKENVPKGLTVNSCEVLLRGYCADCQKYIK